MMRKAKVKPEAPLPDLPAARTWRERAAVLIWEIKKANPRITRKELRAFYPWSERSCYAYRAWCLEARALIGPGRRKKPSSWPEDALPLETE